jgi:FkbM family methyltransferase
LGKLPKIYSSQDCAEILEEVEAQSADYHTLWNARPAGQSLVDGMVWVRQRVDPSKPYFFSQLANGIKFAGDARDFPAILHAAYPTCNSALISSLIREIGDRREDVLDVGTNIGVVAASVARHLAGASMVHAFEPSPETHKIAAATLALNKLNNFTLTQAAIGNQDGEISFQATPGNSAIASTRRHEFPLLNEWQEIAVPCCRIDSIIQQRIIRSVCLIKIDVEGHEMDVLQGSLSTIRKFRPTVVYEFTPVAAPHHGWSQDDSISLLRTVLDFDFEAQIEPSIESTAEAVLTVPFPLPATITDQVNVFARPRVKRRPSVGVLTFVRNLCRRGRHERYE